MELGAVVVVPATENLAAIQSIPPCALPVLESPRPRYSSRMPILGNDVLQSWMGRVRKLGMHSLWLTPGHRDGSIDPTVLRSFARQGIERLLVIKLTSYAEMDLADLIRFHCERRNPVTDVHDARGQLGVSLLDHLALDAGEKYDSSCASTDSGRTSYQFSGYAKRILSAQERQELVGDGLTGACAMRPAGSQIHEQVWLGEGVDLASSVRIIGPTYIGARTIVRAGATIGPFASVERDCVVDCGTTVRQSQVLPNTYLAPGLLIQHGLVDGGFLEDLGRGAVADLQPAGLGSRIQPRESSKDTLNTVATEDFSRTGNSFAWSVPTAPAPQPWLQVPL